MILDNPLERLARLRTEVAAQNGDDPDTEDLTDVQWAKVKAYAGSDYGSPVKIYGRCDFAGMIDHGYLTSLPDVEGDWDMVGIVHLTYIDGDEGEGSAWHSLYALCRMDWVKKIVIGLPSGEAL